MPVIVAGFGVVTTALVLARYPTGQNSDGLLQTIMSLQRLTVFFWGQDRFANLLPALTVGIRDPATNAHLQLLLRVVCGMLAPLFFCALVCSRESAGAAWSATLVSSALLLAFAPQRTISEAFIEASPYGTSLTLGGFAFLAFARARQPGKPSIMPTALRGAGLAATCAAYAVNASLVLVAVPLVVGEFVLFGSLLAMDFAIASLFAGTFTAVLVMVGANGAPPTPLGFGETTIGLLYFGHEMLSKPGYFIWAVSAASFAALGLLRLRPGNARSSGQLGHAVVLAATFAISFVAVALSSWVVLNYLHPRYLVPDYILVASLGGTSLVHVVQRMVRARVGRCLAALAVVACLLLFAQHRPRLPTAESWNAVAPEKKPMADAVAEAVTERSLDGVAGDFWDVWPAIFQSEQAAHDLGEPPGHVFGITYRGEARRAAFNARLLRKGRLTIGCIGADPGWCNALLLQTMNPPGVMSRFSNATIPLPDGRNLSFFTIERPGPASGPEGR